MIICHGNAPDFKRLSVDAKEANRRHSKDFSENRQNGAGRSSSAAMARCA
jgi:hypothetical protein